MLRLIRFCFFLPAAPLGNEHHVIVLEAMNIHYLPAYLSLQNNTLQKIGQIKISNLITANILHATMHLSKDRFLPAFDYHKAGGALMDLNVYNSHAIIGLFGKP